MYAREVFQTIKTRYIDTGKVYYVYKDLPIVSTHPQAALAAEAAECAGDGGKYWEMHAQLFAEPKEWDTTEEAARTSFKRYAAAIGLDEDSYEQCVSEARFKAEVERDYTEARTLGIGGTPAFIINGKLLSGARPAEQFISILDNELQGK